MLLDNLGIVEFSSCLDFTMCQPKKQVEGSYWRCMSCKEIYYNQNKKANSTKMLYFFTLVSWVKRANLTKILKYIN